MKKVLRNIWPLGVIGFLVFFVSAAMAQLNSPYPDADAGTETIFYRAFTEPPKNLDPQVSYTSADSRYLNLCYEPLLTYNYLERPIALMPCLAMAVPEPHYTYVQGVLTEVRYSFEIEQGVYFHDDPCFPDEKGRELIAQDWEFAFKRLADPLTNCPVGASFSYLKGFTDFREDLVVARKKSNGETLPEIYARTGALEGIQVTGRYTFDLILKDKYPQILYWLAMRFVCALPHEAVTFYDGAIHEGVKRPTFREHPVGTGPYVFDWDQYDREAHIVMVRNRRWRGVLYPQRKRPGAVFPTTAGEPNDSASLAFNGAYAGTPLPFVDRIDWFLEREYLSYFNKFIQGYYDVAAIPRESFQKVIQNDNLTPALREKGIRLIKDRGLDVYYVGFNMDDDALGAPSIFHNATLEQNREAILMRNRKLRQAMSLAVDAQEYIRVFLNGLGIPAQSPLPPGLYGYDAAYRNPHRKYDTKLVVARQLLAEAGYPNGVDPKTHAPLELTFDVGNASTQARVQYNFYIDAWRKLGLNVKLAATDYNKFQTKMRDGNYQIFIWGWVADYPDPENFLFLLYGPNSSKKDGRKPNSARFENARYDFLFKKMENLGNNESVSWVEDGRKVTLSRGEIIKKMINLLADECPWIPMMHSENYMLAHEWITHIKPHPLESSMGVLRYFRIDRTLRDVRRKLWNRPMVWPLVVLLVGGILLVLPGIRAYIKKMR